MAVYFVTDFHLGIPTLEDSHERELKLLRFLDSIKADCEELFLMGDLFDFWFEYKSVIPRGFVRIQGKLAEFTDSGIPVHLFIGNHDLSKGSRLWRAHRELITGQLALSPFDSPSSPGHLYLPPPSSLLHVTL